MSVRHLFSACLKGRYKKRKGMYYTPGRCLQSSASSEEVAPHSPTLPASRNCMAPSPAADAGHMHNLWTRAAHVALEGMAILDDNGIILACNPALLQLTGVDESALLHSRITDLFPECDNETFSESVGTLSSTRHWSKECTLHPLVSAHTEHTTPDTTEVELTMYRLEPGYISCVLRDISATKQANRTLFYHAFYDGLTGLANRALFKDRLTQAIRRCLRRADQMYAIILLDVDGFKTINLNWGYAHGDVLLQHMGYRLKQLVRQEDTVARIGSDEFAILLDGASDILDLSNVVERIREEISAPYSIAKHEIKVTAGVGVVVGSDGHENAEVLLRNAFTALSRAKSMGSHGYEVYDASMSSSVSFHRSLETHLRKAVGTEEIFNLFQPIIHLGTRQVLGMEALIRWEHPVRNLLTPDTFLSMAEDTGLILPIGDGAMEQAIQTITSHNTSTSRSCPVQLHLNMSARQLARTTTPYKLQAWLEQSGLAPSLVVVEVTELTLMENHDLMAGILRTFSDMGVKLALDDFGSAKFSMSTLQQLPVQYIKIDQAFISGNHAGPRLSMVRAMIDLIHGMGKIPIAEGVETQAQADILLEYGCSLAQGFHIAAPMAADAAATYNPE